MDSDTEATLIQALGGICGDTSKILSGYKLELGFVREHDEGIEATELVARYTDIPYQELIAYFENYWPELLIMSPFGARYIQGLRKSVRSQFEFDDDDD